MWSAIHGMAPELKAVLVVYAQPRGLSLSSGAIPSIRELGLPDLDAAGFIEP
jgi:hypothetical protein